MAHSAGSAAEHQVQELVDKPGIGFLADLVRRAKAHDITGSAAELGFRFFLAAFPFLIFVTEASGVIASALNVQEPSRELLAFIDESLPEESGEVIRGELERVFQSQSVSLLSLSLLGAISLAATGITAVMKKLNWAFEVEESRPYLKRYAIGVALAISAGLVVIGALIGSILMQLRGDEIAGSLGLSGVAREVLPWVRFPFAAILVLTAISFIYWYGPDTDLPFRWVTPGAVLFLIGWIAASWGYGFYVGNIASYGALYGVLGSVVVALIWFYITAFVLLIGAEVNALVLQRRKPQVQT